MPSVAPSIMPSLSQRRSPAVTRAISFQKQLVTSGPTPPSLIHSPYLENPYSIFNPSSSMVGGWRTERSARLTLPNEHDSLHLLDTVPIRSTSSSPSSSDCESHPKSSSSSNHHHNNSVFLSSSSTSSSSFIIPHSEYMTSSIPMHSQRMQSGRPQ